MRFFAWLRIPFADDDIAVAISSNRSFAETLAVSWSRGKMACLASRRSANRAHGCVCPVASCPPCNGRLLLVLAGVCWRLPWCILPTIRNNSCRLLLLECVLALIVRPLYRLSNMPVLVILLFFTAQIFLYFSYPSLHVSHFSLLLMADVHSNLQCIIIS